MYVIYPEHETTVFHHISTPRRELKMPMTRSGVFLTNFEVFDIVMKQCLILLLKQTDFEGEIKDAKTRSFSSDIQTCNSA